MKFLIVLSIICGSAIAKPSTLLASPTLLSVGAPLISQYHSQDELGQYAYGYNGGLSSKTETKTIDGITRGSYSYVDGDGFLQTVQYTADSLNGFRVAATNLPVAPKDDRTAPAAVQETPEVAQARAEHLAAIKEAKLREAAAPAEEVPEIKENALPAVQELKTLTPFATYGAPVIALKTAEAPLAFSYNYAAPAYAYSVHAPVYAHATPFAYTVASAPAIFARSASPVADPIAAEAEIISPPQPVEDTPEVAQAKVEHFAAVAEVKARNAVVA